MPHLSPHCDRLTHFLGSCTPEELIGTYGSPLYVYNEDTLRQHAREMAQLVNHPGFIASYSTKANANPHLLRIILEEGMHADAMSPGELALLHQAGFDRTTIHYVCNNVSREELIVANQESWIVSVDSLSQLESFCKATHSSRVMIRLNPGEGAGHHQKVITAGKETKFGITLEDLPRVPGILAKYGVALKGLNQHIGSLFMDAEPYLRAAAWLLEQAERFPGLDLIDFGGGFGIPYHKSADEARLDLRDLGVSLSGLVHSWTQKTGYSGRFMIEPGRYVVGESGLLLGTVTACKNNGRTRYVGTDIGFSVIARPVLYDAHHDIEVFPQTPGERELQEQTLVGNICETGDILARGRTLPQMREGDIIGVLDAGAYCSAMASNYTQRLRPAEVLITSAGRATLIRRRDTIHDLTQVYQV